MHFGVVLRTLGVLFLLFSTTLVPPMGISLFYADGQFVHFSTTFAVALALGLVLWLPLYGRPYTIRTRDGFGIVALMWATMSLLGTLPFMLVLGMSFPDALFEATSGYTTTGSTVIIGLDELPRSILLYRQEIQWVGGIGVIVLAVALMPMLGIGGMQLYKAETPGPVKDERLTPRIAQTARTLCVVYTGMTALCALSYWLAGMSLFDAIAHSMSTLATAGFSTHDLSMAYFDSFAIECVAIVFMLAGGISFNVHYVVWKNLAIRRYAQDDQVRAFLLSAVALTVLVAGLLFWSGTRADPIAALRLGLFEAVSVITSTGYALDDFALWPMALPVILIFAGFMGGCAGSTASGMKVIRFQILAKQASVHVHKLIHARSIRPIRINQRVVPETVIEGIWGFFTIYVAIFGVLMILLMMNGIDQVTAFGAVASTLNNLGPGLGEVGVTFTELGSAPKLLLSFAMLLGRLEIFTLLVLITPSFWRD
jgi:trk system potassium uptake protein TrkH